MMKAARSGCWPNRLPAYMGCLLWPRASGRIFARCYPGPLRRIAVSIPRRPAAASCARLQPNCRTPLTRCCRSDSLLVRPVTQWLVAAGLAAAEIDGRAVGGDVFDRGECSLGLVRAVAEWLVLALPARAPPVVLALLHRGSEGCVRSSNGSCHLRFPW